MIAASWKTPLLLGLVASPFLFAGCTQSASNLADGVNSSSVRTKSYAYTAKDRECLARAMFFESRRSSREGLVAVGTVVMNRLESGEYGDTVCSVVGQKGQFAPGVLSRPMDSAALPDVQGAADAVLSGERHPEVKSAMFFHVAGRRFPYKNMHYVLVAGGNAFYEKRSRRRAPQPVAPAEVETAVASAMPATAPAKVQTAFATVGSRADAAKGGRVFTAAAGEITQPARIDTGIVPVRQEAVMSYEASPEAADALGALLFSLDRPPEQ